MDTTPPFVAPKDRPGFIANRIVAPVVVYNGLMVDRDGFTPADIDLSMMKNGQKMGPMELADFTGVDVTSFCQDSPARILRFSCVPGV